MNVKELPLSNRRPLTFQKIFDVQGKKKNQNKTNKQKKHEPFSLILIVWMVPYVHSISYDNKPDPRTTQCTHILIESHTGDMCYHLLLVATVGYAPLL